MKRLMHVFLLAAFYLGAAAQPKPGVVINGKVTSFEESLPLEGASIVVKGGANATGTQADGTFTLLLNPGDSVLVVSLAGYDPQEIRTSARNKQYDIVLRRSDKAFVKINNTKSRIQLLAVSSLSGNR